MDLRGHCTEQHVEGHQDATLGIVSHAISNYVGVLWSVEVLFVVANRRNVQGLLEGSHDAWLHQKKSIMTVYQLCEKKKPELRVATLCVDYGTVKLMAEDGQKP